MMNFRDTSLERKSVRWSVAVILLIGIIIGGVVAWLVVQAPATPAEKERARDFTNNAKVTLEGTAMEPTFSKGTILEFAPRQNHIYSRGEVIWLNDPKSGPQVRHVRRIIGIAGDTLEMRSGTLYLNGAAVVENYIKSGPTADFAPVKVAADQLFVMGDNRAAAEDSRQWGPVAVNLVRGIQATPTPPTQGK